MDTATARALGSAAYHANQPCVPASDPKIIEAITGLPVGGGATEIMRAWVTGWCREMLAEMPAPDGDL